MVTWNVIFDEKPRQKNGESEFDLEFEEEEDAETLPAQERPERGPQIQEPVGVTDVRGLEVRTAPGSVDSGRPDRCPTFGQGPGNISGHTYQGE